MATTMRPDAPGSHYRRPSRVSRYCAKRLGIKPESVEQLVKGHDAVHIRTAVLIEGAILHGDHALVARILAPIEAARAGASSGESPAELLAADVAADSAEDCPRLEYLTSPTAESRNALLRRLRDRAGVLLRLIAALEREQREARA